MSNHAVDPAWQLVELPHPTDHQRRVPVLVSTDDRPSRWTPGRRLHDLLDRRAVDAAGSVAIETDEGSTTMAELVELGAALAVALRRRGLRPGDRVLLLVDRSIWSHVVVLALSRLSVAYVPVDVSFPDDRIEFIANDAQVSHALTLARFGDRCSRLDAPTILLDRLASELELARYDVRRGRSSTSGEEPDPLAYVIYTSGSTGTPKGVQVRHSSIWNFVEVAAERYGYRPHDRVYQGMTIAFDFSVEELWVPLVAGATLVPAPSEFTLVGDDLQQFLLDRRITALCCVPTLLATLQPSLPYLRLLLVSGEACPPDLIEPWLVPGRRVLNAYGPTETTVTATWSVVRHGRPVTIGGPLPTYTAVVLDPDTPTALAPGEAGELAIGGIAVADGYLNRPEQTERAFVPDVLGLPNNPGGRIYRTGDLARITPDGEIEYLGRLDTQVKIRGYRIELDEIEVVARSAPSVGNAVVHPYSPPGAPSPELVAYLTAASPDEPIDLDDVVSRLQAALPRYMLPAFYEILPALPLLPSTKVDRHALPPPAGHRRAGPSDAVFIAPASDLEARLAELLGSLLNGPSPSVTAHLIDDLGANSFTLAGFVATIRDDLGIAVSVRQLYQHPTIASLAASLGGGTARPDRTGVDAVIQELPSPLRFVPHHPGRSAAVSTAIAQLLYWVFVVAVGSTSSVAALRYVDSSSGAVEAYVRAVGSGVVLFVGGSLLLLIVRWIAMPTYRPRPIRVYSPTYLRFWIARMAIQSNPANLLVGTPTYHLYLRLLGVRLGRSAVVLTRPPICPTLVRIGAGAVVRERCHLPAYRVTDGYVCPGTIIIGDHAVVAEATMLDIATVVGAGAHLGASSSVQRGQSLPGGSRTQGSPAAPTPSRIDRVVRWERIRGRATRYAVAQFVGFALFVLPVPLTFAWATHHVGFDIERAMPWTGGPGRVAGAFSLGALATVGAVLFAVARAAVPSRVIRPLLRVGEPLPLFGLDYHLARMTVRMSNNPVLHSLFGDSSLIVHYLRLLGYDMRTATQTGSNFGMTLRHHVPSLCRFDRNTLVSDGLAISNMEVSASSFIVRPIHVPPDTYIGNQVHLPGRNALGDNCLIGTKAAVPITGPIREGVGILGSPSFEIPRTVARDHEFDDLKRPEVLRGILRRKLRTNLATIAASLIRSWLLISIAAVFVLEAFPELDTDSGPLLDVGAALTLATLVSAVIGFGVLVAFERLARRNRPIEPRFCSLYDRSFWFHERYWKLNYSAFTRFFVGSPIRPALFRLAGARIGRGVFDDGAGLIEPSMLTIGDHTTLNAAAVLQCHSLEDGAFKSDVTVIGDRCTIGPAAFVHYGVVLAPDTTVEPDAFVMKGSVSSLGSRWIGNPAQETISARPTALVERERDHRVAGADPEHRVLVL